MLNSGGGGGESESGAGQDAEEKIRTKKDAALWLRARDLAQKKLGHIPSNADLVRFAQGEDGAFIRHFFPFDDVQSSAREHWVFLAGCYTRRALVVIAGDPGKAPTQIRALHIVVDEEGNKGVATLEQCARNKKWGDQVIEDARRSLEAFVRKHEQLNRVLRDRRLARAVEKATEALRELGEEEAKEMERS
jgi:hypothetical protein